jgi:hypothetical protein
MTAIAARMVLLFVSILSAGAALASNCHNEASSPVLGAVAALPSPRTLPRLTRFRTGMQQTPAYRKPKAPVLSQQLKKNSNVIFRISPPAASQVLKAARFTGLFVLDRSFTAGFHQPLTRRQPRPKTQCRA